jgi:5-hydroxyisourate hydrolase-like protein (transthyretin family)
MKIRYSAVRAALLCSLVLGGALLVTRATAMARTTTKATISASSYTPSYGDEVKRTATLKTSSGSAVSGRTLKIQRWTGTEWTTIKSAETNSKGKIYTYKIPYGKKTTKYRARYSGSTKYYPATSSIITVKPRAYLTKPVGPSTWTVASPFTVKGWLKPAHPVNTAAVFVYRYHGTSASGPWTQDGRAVGYAKKTAAGDYYYAATVMIPDSPYKYWRFRAYHPNDAWNSAKWSSEVIWMVND